MMDLSGKKVKKTLSMKGGDNVVLIDTMGAPASVPPDEINRNVYRVDGEGRVVWKIDSLAQGGERFPYTNIYVDESGRVKAYCWDGGEYLVDVNTGKVSAGDPLK